MSEPLQIGAETDTGSAPTSHGPTAGSIDWDGYGSFPIEITEVVPEDSFGFRWSGVPAEQLDEYSTHVRFTISDAGTGTDVTVIESGFDTLPGGTRYRRARLEQNREGWDVELDELDELAILLEGDTQ